jgi:hypothetical protein
MSKNLMGIPTNSPLMQTATQLSIPWMKYLKALGDDALTANKLANSASSNSFKYTINGNICFYVYNVSELPIADVEITLPYTALTAFEFNGAIYQAGTKKVIIPATKSFLQGWYMISFDNN